MKAKNFVKMIVMGMVGILALMFLLVACEKDAEQIAQSSNPNIKVEQLLTVEGYKVFRFQDGGYNIYFVIPSGSVHWNEVVTTGKVTYTRKHDVYTGDPENNIEE